MVWGHFFTLENFVLNKLEYLHTSLTWENRNYRSENNKTDFGIPLCVGVFKRISENYHFRTFREMIAFSQMYLLYTLDVQNIYKLLSAHTIKGWKVLKFKYRRHQTVGSVGINCCLCVCKVCSIERSFNECTAVACKLQRSFYVLLYFLFDSLYIANFKNKHYKRRIRVGWQRRAARQVPIFIFPCTLWG